MRIIGKNITAIALATLATVAATQTPAQEPLRWKFNVGDKLQYDTDQDITMTFKGSPLGDIALKTHQQMDMTWEVMSTNDQGEAVIRQQIGRVRASMSGPTGQAIEYDSDAKEAPVGGAAIAAGVFEAMKKGNFEFTLTPRGELKNVKVSKEVIAAFKSSPQAAQMGDQITPEGIQKILMQDSIILPEKAPSPGETWKAKTEVSVPTTGKQIIDTTYKYEGTKEIEEKTHAIIRLDRKISLAPAENPAMQMSIKEQSSNGESLFNIADGRLGSMTLKHNVVMSVTAAGQSIEQELDQASAVTVKPVEESQDSAKSDTPSSETEE